MSDQSNFLAERYVHIHCVATAKFKCIVQPENDGLALNQTANDFDIHASWNLAENVNPQTYRNIRT